MNLEGFQIIDNEANDSSLIKRDFLKNHQQQAATLNDSDQFIAFMFGEKNNYHHIRNVYLQYEMTKQKYVANAADRNPIDGDAFRLVKNCFA